MIVPWDPFDPSLSLAALPAAAAGTVGGLPTVDASNSVKVQVGTGPNQLNLSSGNVSVFANGDKAGYSLTQAFPGNFANLAIATSGSITAGTVADKSGYSLATAPPNASQVAAAVWSDTAAADFAVAGSPGKALLSNLDTNVGSRMAASAYAAPPSTAAIASAILATPGNPLATDASGKVGANNLPSDYQQRGTAVLLPTAPPAGYGGSAPSLIAAAVWSDTAAADFAVAGSPGKALLSNLDTNVGSRMAASAYAAPPSTAAIASAILATPGNPLATDASGRVTAGIIADKSGYKISSDGLDAVAVEAGVNARQAVSAILASAVGVLSGAASNKITIQGGNVSTTRISATVDAQGNRPSITLNLPA